jgi:hypothetical protein
MESSIGSISLPKRQFYGLSYNGKLSRLKRNAQGEGGTLSIATQMLSQTFYFFNRYCEPPNRGNDQSFYTRPDIVIHGYRTF